VFATLVSCHAKWAVFSLHLVPQGLRIHLLRPIPLHEGFCSRSMLQGQFTWLVHTEEQRMEACSILWYTWRRSAFKFVQFAPESCSQIFNRFNVVEHLSEWKFCSREWIIHPWNRWCKRKSFAPGACPQSITKEQNRSCGSAFRIWSKWLAKNSNRNNT